MMKWEELLCTRRTTDQTKSSTRHPDDERTEFERDYDRVVFASSFRRLQDKAQVFPLETSDFVRTRLTHSIEVSTLGRSLSVDVGRRLVKAKKVNPESLPEDLHSFPEQIATIVATTSLAHDLGNPPFGHFGEQAIRDWFAEWFKDPQATQYIKGFTNEQRRDFEQFEGNAQAFRILTKLQLLHHEHGMKLTYGTLASFLKYPCSSLEAVQNDIKLISRKKPGYFQSEKDIFNSVIAATGSGCNRHPLVFLMEAADDIAYSAIDIEDAVKKGVVSLDEVLDVLSRELDGCANRELISYMESIVERLPTGRAESKVLMDAVRGIGPCLRSGKYFELFNKLNDIRRSLPTDWPEPDNVTTQWLRILVQGVMVRACSDSFLEHYDSIMAGTFNKSLIKASSAGDMYEALKKVASAKVYNTPSVLTLEYVGKEVIHGLLDRFVRASLATDRDDTGTANGKLYALISPTFRYIEKRANCGPVEYNRLQLVTDFICGMTDTYAVNLYRRLTGIDI